MKNILLIFTLLFFSYGCESRCPDQSAAAKLGFWVGSWDVKTAEGQTAGVSTITLNEDCTITENWQGASGLNGSSNNYWDSETEQLTQRWEDMNGEVHLYRGRQDSTGVVLETGPTVLTSGDTVRLKMHLSPTGEGRVIQQGWYSLDKGESWQDYYYLVYHSAADSTESE